MESLPCQTIVFRAMARPTWIDLKSRTVLPDAFFRRKPPADEDGLSVNIESAQSCEKALKKCHGVASLNVGRIRELVLDVVVDEAPHAILTGLPRQEDALAEAIRLASQLSRQARLVLPEA
jgi:hypothetical protein